MIRVADILRGSIEKYLESRKLSFKQQKVVSKIINCFSDDSPELIFACTNSECDYTEPRKKPCRDRHCNRCNVTKKLKWLLKVVKEFLPLPYYHIVFTIPAELRNLMLCNQSNLYDKLFKSSFYVLNKFAEDKKHFGGKIGYIGLLHTWGSKLNYHPHIHFMVLSGGISRGKYKGLPYKEDFIFPVTAMSIVMMGKYIEMLKESYKNGELKFPGKLERISSDQEFNNFLYRLSKKEWVIYSKPPFSGTTRVLEYVSRYTHRVAISNSRLRSYKEGRVRFEYKDYDDKDKRGVPKKKLTEMNDVEFIRRYLLHILPDGFRKIRYGGIFSSNQKKGMLKIIRDTLEERIEKLKESASEWIEKLEEEVKDLCPRCLEKLLPKRIESLSGYV